MGKKFLETKFKAIASRMAVKGTDDIWRSKVDNSKIYAHMSSDQTMIELIQKGVTDQIQAINKKHVKTEDRMAQIGFNPKTKKWYG